MKHHHFRITAVCVCLTLLLCAAPRAHATLLFLDTYNNIVGGDLDFNEQYNVAGRQSGTAAPRQYAFTKLDASAFTQVGQSSTLYPNRLRIVYHSLLSPFYNFTDSPSFSVEAVITPSSSPWVALGFGKDSTDSWYHAQGMSVLFFGGANLGLYQVFDGSTLIGNGSSLGTPPYRVRIGVHQTDFAGTNTAFVAMFVNDVPVPLVNWNPQTTRKHVYRRATGFTNNYVVLQVNNHEAVVDDVAVRAVTGALYTARWLEDGDLTELAPGRTFTHKVAFGSAAPFSVNSVSFDPFEALANGALTNLYGANWSFISSRYHGGDVASAGMTNFACNTVLPNTSAIALDGKNILNAPWYREQNNQSWGLMLSGLTPGNVCQLSLYTCGVLVPGTDRIADYAFSADGAIGTADINMYPDGTGLVVRYTYMVPESGVLAMSATPLMIVAGGGNTRIYGFSNWVVPEPGAALLLALAVWGLRRR